MADETDTGGGDDDDEDDEGADPGNDYSDDDYDYGCDAPTNECYTDADCPAAATCGSHPCGTACHHVPEMPECDQSLLETGSIGPLQGDIVSLAFLDASSPTGPVLAVGFADGGGVYSTEGQPVSELPLPEGASVREMVTGDFDGDGDEDLVVMSDAEARLLLGDGAGTFTAAASTGEIVGLTAIEALDFDGDGNLDLAVGSTAPMGSDAEEGVAIHAGDGAGGLAAPTLVLPVRTNDLARGEFDGTSPEDLVVAVGGNNGSYARMVFGAAGLEPAVHSVDMNEEWWTHFVVAGSFDGPNVAVLIGQSDDRTTLGVHPDESSPAQRIVVPGVVEDRAVGDLDGDDLDELVLAATDRVTVLTSNGREGGWVFDCSYWAGLLDDNEIEGLGTGAVAIGGGLLAAGVGNSVRLLSPD